MEEIMREELTQFFGAEWGECCVELIEGGRKFPLKNQFEGELYDDYYR